MGPGAVVAIQLGYCVSDHLQVRRGLPHLQHHDHEVVRAGRNPHSSGEGEEVRARRDMRAGGVVARVAISITQPVNARGSSATPYGFTPGLLARLLPLARARVWQAAMERSGGRR